MSHKNWKIVLDNTEMKRRREHLSAMEPLLVSARQESRTDPFTHFIVLTWFRDVCVALQNGLNVIYSTENEYLHSPLYTLAFQGKLWGQDRSKGAWSRRLHCSERLFGRVLLFRRGMFWPIAPFEKWSRRGAIWRDVQSRWVGVLEGLGPSKNGFVEIKK